MEERKIIAGVPQRQQVRIVRTARLSALAGSVNGDRFVPIARIQNLAVARAGNLLPRVTAGGIHGIFIAWARNGAKTEKLSSLPLLIESVAKSNRMQLSPRPLRRIRAHKFFQL